MKQSLDIRIGQHLTITPQLQQAIRLLQLSSAELQQEIQDALESNPLLEDREQDENHGESADSAAKSDSGESGGEDADLAPADLTMERGNAEDGDSNADGSESTYDGDWAEAFDSPK